MVSRRQETATLLARSCGAPLALTYADLDTALSAPPVDVVCVNSPNHLHAQHAIAAARAGKHVIVEKPLCLSLVEADAVLSAAQSAGVGLAYAENLCFAPLYRQARALLISGAIGRVLRARHCEKHAGPYSPWFWNVEEAGGGALLDLGCHSVECLRWLLGKPRITRVSAELRRVAHADKTRLEDDARVALELEDGTQLIAESSWAHADKSESRLEVRGQGAVLEASLLGESGLRLRQGDGDWERVAATETGDSAGYVEELTHFLDCFRAGREPEESGHDGRAVLEILLAAYASAQRGEPVALPFDPGDVARPVDLWLS